MWFVAALAALALVALNADLYLFFLRRRGVLFAARAIPLHWFYFLYSSAVFVYVWVVEREHSRGGHDA
jgi:hypothetical protein